MTDLLERSLVEWRPWGPEAFADAAAAEKPILLSVVTPWSEWCARMDEEAFGVPTLAGNIHESFIPVRVNADEQPMVRERHTTGGFPSTVFLTPSGEQISAVTYMDAEGLRSVLERVREVYDEKGDDAGRVPRALASNTPPQGAVTPDVERLLAGQLEDKFDEVNGGWGKNEKFPMPGTVEFALKRDRARATRTLDAIERHLRADDGGFYRFAHEPDWSDPQRERLLDTQAGVTRAFSHAYLATGEEAYRETAEGAIDYLTGTLWTGDFFAGSEVAEGVDDHGFADRNAVAADALLAYAAYTDDDVAARYAERTLDFLESLWDGEALTHFVTDAPRSVGRVDSPTGLLGDYAGATRAFAHAAQILDPAYAETAAALADAAIDSLSTESGAFKDGPTSAEGLLDRELHPVDDNAVLADALVDLAVLTGDESYRERAEDAIGAFAGAADRMGVQVAVYGTAASRVVARPLTIRVADAPGSDLHRAALRMADHEKIVVPDADGPTGTAAVETDAGERGRADDPESLARLVADSA